MNPERVRTGTVLSVIFNRQWWRSTLLVLVAILVMMRLGFWQLERGAERRARNVYISQQMAAEPLPLVHLDLSKDLEQHVFRSVTVHGEYDHKQQVILRGQKFHGQPGVNLITAMVLHDSGRAVLVNRGWIPYESAAPAQLAQFDEPGPRLVSGRVRLSEPLPINADASRSAQIEWYRMDIAALQRQMTYNLLPVYVQLQPNERAANEFPQRVPLEFELSDGPHLGYAIQWFLFVPLLVGGYLHFLRKSTVFGQGETP